MGKADAIGYAVCHRIEHRSFFLDDRQLPLCARCTGMYLGALITVLFQLPRGKSGGMPSKIWLVFLGFLTLFFGVDGLNSFVRLIPNAPSVYESQNWLRLATGTGMGVCLGAVIYPIFNQSVWSDWNGKASLGGARQFILLVLTLVLANLIVLTGIPILLYPLAITGTFMVLVILTMVYTIVWLMISGKENTFETLNELRLPLVVGLAIALAQIIIMDGLRYLWSGTWLGFQL